MVHTVLDLIGIQCTHASQNTADKTVVTASHLHNAHGTCGFMTASHLCNEHGACGYTDSKHLFAYQDKGLPQQLEGS